MIKDWTVHSRYTDDVVGLLPQEFIAMRTADGNFVPWQPSQTDVLATDWERV
ncbi:DUF2829 domain-containing protein [Clostridium tyrobutyricum]|nr:DUF2829 domain-containing protein [Clostridium tyrobutyricum]